MCVSVCICMFMCMFVCVSVCMHLYFGEGNDGRVVLEISIYVFSVNM